MFVLSIFDRAIARNIMIRLEIRKMFFDVDFSFLLVVTIKFYLIENVFFRLYIDIVLSVYIELMNVQRNFNKNTINITDCQYFHSMYIKIFIYLIN